MAEPKLWCDEFNQVRIRVTISRHRKPPVNLCINGVFPVEAEDFLYTDFCSMSNKMMSAVRDTLKSEGVRI